MKYLMGLLGALVLASCAGEKVSDPVFGPDETPYIYMEWSSSQVYSVGDVIKYTAQVSYDTGLAAVMDITVFNHM